MQAKLMKANEFSNQISKMNQENIVMKQESNSIEELFDKQTFDVEESPDKHLKKSTFESQESAMRDHLSAEDTGDSQIYDKIIQKIIDNPKIDKRVLMKRFIAKIEMESNNAGGFAGELNQIKKLIQGFANQPADGKLLNDTINAEEQFYSDEDVVNNFNPMHSIGEEQIAAANQSAD